MITVIPFAHNPPSNTDSNIDITSTGVYTYTQDTIFISTTMCLQDRMICQIFTV